MRPDRGCPDALIAVESAVMMAQRFGQDMAIMPDLSVKKLADVESGAISGAPLEIIRCPRIWKRQTGEQA